jgi:hypothetical protein
VYRWAHGSYHTSGHSLLADIDPLVEPGTIFLHPHWSDDYVGIAAAKAAAQHA